MTVPILGLGFQYVVYKAVAEHYNFNLLNGEEVWVWVTAFILYDVCYYWMHRIHHEIKVFWATHVVHHHGEEFNLSTALRQTSTGFLWKWVFFLPIFIIGIPPHIYVSVAGLNLVYQFWVHTEHIGRLGFLEYIFVTPSNHRVHHAQNEDYLDAAIRELEEETSIKNVELIKEIEGTLTYELPDNLLGIIWKGKYKGQKQKWFLMRFLGTDNEINIQTKKPEFLEWKWIDINKITDVVVDFKFHVYRELKEKIKKIIN